MSRLVLISLGTLLLVGSVLSCGGGHPGGGYGQQPPPPYPAYRYPQGAAQTNNYPESNNYPQQQTNPGNTGAVAAGGARYPYRRRRAADESAKEDHERAPGHMPKHLSDTWEKKYHGQSFSKKKLESQVSDLKEQTTHSESYSGNNSENKDLSHLGEQEYAKKAVEDVSSKNKLPL